jgi:pyrophosphatase PpaX
MMSGMGRTPRVNAIIFDLDGTLADTFPLIVAAWNAAVTPHTGITYSDADVIARFGIPDPFMIRRDLPGDAGEQADATYHAHYEREHATLVKPFAGVSEMLAELHRRRVPLGLMTGKGRRTARITVNALGWGDTFGAIVTGEDVKEQKPQPEGPLLAAKMLGVAAKECAFVGDSPADIGAGKAAGMLTVMAGWHPVYVDEVRKLEPDVWAESPRDLLRIIMD